jgi:P27 family predicted phage terminase small subunit
LTEERQKEYDAVWGYGGYKGLLKGGIMGARGLPPTPTEILELRGSWRAKTRGPEPQPPKGAPEPPEWIAGDNDLLAIWTAVLSELEKLTVLAQTDGLTIARYCRWISRWQKAWKVIEREGERVPLTDREGNVVNFTRPPEAKTIEEAERHLKDFEDRFALSPSARSRIQLDQRGAAPEKKGVHCRERRA